MSAYVEKRSEPTHARGSEYLHGVLYGVIPLTVVAVIIAGAFLLASIVRLFIGVSTFQLQQSIVLIILGSGVALALVAFTLALIFTLRNVARWQRNGPIERAHAALWTLGASAVVILLPFLLAFVFP